MNYEVYDVRSDKDELIFYILHPKYLSPFDHHNFCYRYIFVIGDSRILYDIFSLVVIDICVWIHFNVAVAYFIMNGVKWKTTKFTDISILIYCMAQNVIISAYKNGIQIQNTTLLHCYYYYYYYYVSLL